MKHKLLAALALLGLSIGLGHSQTNPLLNGKLMSTLDANAQDITSVDQISFGGPTPSARLHLRPGATPTTAADGIKFGDDVSLYRSTTATLALSGNLIVTGTITGGGGSPITLSSNNTWTGSNTFNGAVSVGDNGLTFTATGRTATQTALQLVPGTNLQAYDAQLSDFAALAPTKGRLAVADGTNWLPLTVGTNGQVLTADSAQALGIKWAAASGGAITFDIGDDGGNDSVALTEIATTGDTNSIFTESAPDKLLINLGADWPKADQADVALTGDSATAFFTTGAVEAARLDTAVILASEIDTAVELNALTTDTDMVLDTDIGSTVQAWDAQLDDVAAVDPTKGRLLVGNGTDWINLNVGTDGQVLKADSGQATGLAWAADGGGAGQIAIEQGDLAVGDGDIATLDFLTADFGIAEAPDTEINISIKPAITRDTEWDTAAEINAATTDDDFVTVTSIDTKAEFNASITDATFVSTTDIDTAAEINALTTDADFILPADIDTAAELNALTTDTDMVLDTDIGTTVQAYDAQLSDLAGLTPTKGNLVVGNGTNWISIGVGTNNQVVMADSAQASGVKWSGVPAAGRWEVLELTVPDFITDTGTPATLKEDVNLNTVESWAFDQTNTEELWFKFRLPDDWDNATAVKFKVVWREEGTAVGGGVYWVVQCVAMGDGDTATTLQGAGGAMADTSTGVTDDVMISPAGAPTISGTPAAGDMVLGKIGRIPANGADTLANDALLDMLLIQYYRTGAATPW